MGVASAVLCAEELEGELEAELGRARREREVLKSVDGAKIEARLSERREFEDRAEALQKRLRAFLRSAADELGIPAGRADTFSNIVKASDAGPRLAELTASITALARELSQVNAVNHRLAERVLSVTKAYVRALSPRPSAYDRRGAESTHSSALSSMSRRA